MKKVLIIGGDNRLKALKSRLSSDGYKTDSLGLFENDNGSIENADVIILPVPTTKDKENIFTPLTHRKIPLSEIYEKTDKNQLILSCNYSFEGKNSVDYGALDSYALLNAVPTAEGAISLAIENTDFALWNSSVLVIGCGRVGKILADRLKALGAKVTVSARKDRDFAYLSALGFDYINTTSLSQSQNAYRIIFNTVDAKVLDDTALERLTCDLMIDLSSFGGFSLEKAEKCGIKAIKAPALPLKTAPETASEILYETVTQIIDKNSGEAYGKN